MVEKLVVYVSENLFMCFGMMFWSVIIDFGSEVKFGKFYYVVISEKWYFFEVVNLSSVFVENVYCFRDFFLR